MCTDTGDQNLIREDRVVESTLGERDMVSFGETTLEEGAGGVWGRQTLECKNTHKVKKSNKECSTQITKESKNIKTTNISII